MPKETLSRCDRCPRNSRPGFFRRILGAQFVPIENCSGPEVIYGRGAHATIETDYTTSTAQLHVTGGQELCPADVTDQMRSSSEAFLAIAHQSFNDGAAEVAHSAARRWDEMTDAQREAALNAPTYFSN